MILRRDQDLIGTLLGKPLNRVQKTCEDSIRRPQRIEFSQFDLSDNPTAAETHQREDAVYS